MKIPRYKGCGTYEWYNNLTVRVCLKLDVGTNGRPEGDMVIDLAVDGEDYFSILTDKRLSTGVCVTKSLWDY